MSTDCAKRGLDRAGSKPFAARLRSRIVPVLEREAVAGLLARARARRRVSRGTPDAGAERIAMR